MKQKYEHLLNLDMQRMILICGLPGSGKSTIAKEFEKAGYVTICPDTYRGKISKTIEGREHWTDAMHEGDQSVSKQAWDMAQKDVVKFIKEGKSVVFDALLSTRKARRKLILNYGKVHYFAVHVDTTLKTSLERNIKREEDGGRFVPEFVIHDKWKTQVLPSTIEGFEEVIILSELKVNKHISAIDRNKFIEDLVKNPRKTIYEMQKNDELKNWFPSLHRSWGMSQDNHHHSLALHEHMITAAELIEDRSPEMVVTALLHDIGKRNTKQFFCKVIGENDFFKIGEKLTIIKNHSVGVAVEKRIFSGVSQSFLPYDIIELDPNAHFYNHETVGAIDARRELLNIGFDEDFANKVYKNILHHMDLPFKPSGNKHFKKLIEKVGHEGIRNLLAMRKADKLSGSEKPEFLEIHESMIQQIEELLERR